MATKIMQLLGRRTSLSLNSSLSLMFYVSLSRLLRLRLTYCVLAVIYQPSVCHSYFWMAYPTQAIRQPSHRWFAGIPPEVMVEAVAYMFDETELFRTQCPTPTLIYCELTFEDGLLSPDVLLHCKPA